MSNISFSSINFDNSSISLISFPTFLNSPPSTKYFKFTDLSFNNCYFTSQRSVLKTEGIEYNYDILFELNNITFSDIVFATRGLIMELDHQLPSNLTISNSVFTNISFGYVKIASKNIDNTALLTNVFFNNVTVDNTRQDSTSFIEVGEGGRLSILGSKFRNMYTLSDGAVLTGGTKATVTTVTNTVFQNNTAQNGGVFNVEEDSVINIHNCTMTQSFGINSGVINVIRNGYFGIYDSFIYNNYANNNPVSQLFDSVTTSTISNTMIYNNNALSKTELDTEFNTACSKL